MRGSEQRTRLVAILAADAAGYSRLMADDEAATVAALDAARAVFRKWSESHQGRVVDTAGDSVLAIFALATGAKICRRRSRFNGSSMPPRARCGKTGACAFASACTSARSSRRPTARCTATA